LCKPHCGGYGQVRVRVGKQVSRTCPGPGALSVSVATEQASKSNRWLVVTTAAAARRSDGWLVARPLLPIGSGRMVVCAVFTGFVRYWGAAYTSSGDRADGGRGIDL